MAHETVQLRQEILKNNRSWFLPSYESTILDPRWDRIRNDPEVQQYLGQIKIISDEMIRKYRIQ